MTKVCEVLQSLREEQKNKYDDYPSNLMLSIGVIPAETEAEFKKQAEGLRYVLASQSLTENERMVLKARYQEQLTTKETGKILGFSSDRVRQIETKALRKLRHPIRRQAVAYGLWRFKTIQSAEEKITELNTEISRLNEEISSLEQQKKDLQAELNELDVMGMNQRVSAEPVGKAEDKYKQVCSLYESGLSREQIAKKAGISLSYTGKLISRYRKENKE